MRAQPGLALLALQVSVMCLVACGPGEVKAPPPRPLAASALTAILTAADQAIDTALASGEAGGLSLHLAGSALATDEWAIRQEAQGPRPQELALTRVLVHQGGSPQSPQGVLAIEAQERLVTSGGSPGPWMRIFRQWWARLKLQGGRWLVVADSDLPPSQWWR